MGHSDANVAIIHAGSILTEGHSNPVHGRLLKLKREIEESGGINGGSPWGERGKQNKGGNGSVTCANEELSLSLRPEEHEKVLRKRKEEREAKYACPKGLSTHPADCVQTLLSLVFIGFPINTITAAAVRYMVCTTLVK